MKKGFVIVILIAMVTTDSFTQNITQKSEPDWPSVQELLQKYGQTLDSIKTFMCKSETQNEGTGTDRSGKPMSWKRFTSSETRFDGSRVSKRNYEWGTNISLDGREIKKSDAFYRSDLWDGKNFFTYSRSSPNIKSGNYPGTANITYDAKIHEKIIRQYAVSPFHIANLGDDGERIDLFLLKEKRVTVRNKLERIGGSDCFVIDALTTSGKYTIWIDPAHGYNIAQSEIRHTEGDVIFAGQLQVKKGQSGISNLKNVRFEKIGDYWVPMEYDYFGSGNIQGQVNEKSHHKFTDVILNPENNAFGLFAPEDILDGTRVTVMHIPNKKLGWLSGKVVDIDKNIVIDFTDKKTELGK